MIHFGSFSLLLTFGALTGVVVAVALTRITPNRTANRLLAALLIVVVLRLVPYIIGFAGFYDAWPWLSFAPFDLPLSIGPLLWLYVVRLIHDRMPERWQLHMLPAALHLLCYGIIFVVCTVPQKTAIVERIVDPFVSPAIVLTSLLLLATYGVRAFLELQKYQRWLDGHLSNREEFRLTWLKTVLLSFAGTGLLWFAFAAIDLFVEPLSYFQEFPFYLTQAAMVWLLGILAMRHAATRYPVPSTDSASEGIVPPAESSTRNEADYAALGAEYLTAIRANGWARDSQLTLTLLAKRLETNPTYLSRALNQGLGQSFNECINRLRVEYVQSEIRGGSGLALVQIGFDAGFNSKASFQRAFALYAGTTPSAFREAQKRDSGN